MRLFIAIDLPSEIKQFLRPLFQNPLAGGKWVPLDQLHLTLRFLGELDAAQFEAIKTSLNSIHEVAFPLTLKGLGCFPNPARARVLWVGTEAPPPLFRLQNQAEATAQQIGLAPEIKAFSPHITLARFKFRPPPILQNYLEKHRDFQSPSWETREFHLYSSLLTPKGALHKVEQTYRLG